MSQLQKFPIFQPPIIEPTKTGSAESSPNSAPSRLTPQQINAAEAVAKLFTWCLLPDVNDTKSYLAGATLILSDYPAEVLERIADPGSGSRVLKDRPTLRELRLACDELFAPIEREWQRRAIEEQRQAFLPRPMRTPEAQKRIDHQVAKAKVKFESAKLSQQYHYPRSGRISTGLFR